MSTTAAAFLRKRVKSRVDFADCFSVFQQRVGQAHIVQDTITFLLVTLLNIHRFKKKSLADSSMNLYFLITTPLHLKHVATLPWNLSLMACFADINVLQGSVTTYARCVGIFGIQLTANLPRNLPVKKCFK